MAQFMLLIRGDDEVERSPAEMQGIVEEYMAWARKLRNEGRMKIDFKQGISPDLVAAKVLAALRNNRTETIVGAEARWLLLLNCFLPRLVDRLLARKVRQLYR